MKGMKLPLDGQVKPDPSADQPWSASQFMAAPTGLTQSPRLSGGRFAGAVGGLAWLRGLLSFDHLTLKAVLKHPQSRCCRRQPAPPNRAQRLECGRFTAALGWATQFS